MGSKRVEEEYITLLEQNQWNNVYQGIGHRSQAYPYTIVEAKKLENKPLNRYRDVNPYDHTRIILQKENFFTDYINANLVKMEKANRQYILTQGPLVFTSGHFWLMVWEQNSPAIIMLNRIIEKTEHKCHWYWPHGNDEKFKVVYDDVNISIIQVEEFDYNYYTIRRLKVTYEETGESREVWHFHYTTWPDFEVPESPHAFLDFLQRVRDYGALDCKDDNGPAIVHCSAGIGRSGTFCLVDSVLVLIEKEGQANVDIQDILLDMRRYRMGLIQTAEQLRFSYIAIVEGIKRLDPNYVPTEPINESVYSAVADEEEAPPPPPPRGESLGRPPKRPLPAIPASASMGTIDMSTNMDSEESDAPPTPPPRDQKSSNSRRDTPSPASSAYGDDDIGDDIGDDEDDTTETTESTENAVADGGLVASGDGMTGDGVRKRRALAERVAVMKKKSREADRWHSFKRSLVKPLALSVGLLAVAGIFIYAYAKH